MHLKPKHVTQHLEAYFDNRLTLETRRQVEAHLAECRFCAQHFFDIQRVQSELGPVLKKTLGQPVPPPALRRQVREALEASNRPHRFSFFWTTSGRLLNAAGTLAIMALLALGVYTILQDQLLGVKTLPQRQSLRSATAGGNLAEVRGVPSANLTPLPGTTATPTLGLTSLGDTLPRPTPTLASLAKNKVSTPFPPAGKNNWLEEGERPWMQVGPSPATLQVAEPEPPAGTIAFSVFNPAPDREFYEIHLIDPGGIDHRLFALEGVSEPALSPDGQQIAYRAWSEPTSPRSLLSSNLEGDPPHRIGGFWEDAQPDWSPTEYRIIFASQREIDRRWRLYTSWGDGTNEVNLRREGKAPTFAPDGYRFAFEACDHTGNRCGLWQGDLDNSEYGSYPFLEDPLAQSPDWSPVDEQIVYMANSDENWDLYLVNSDGNNVRRLTSDPAVDGLPVWSPDGEWLAFLSNRGGMWGIWLYQVDTGQSRPATSLSDVSFTPPERSPYGQRNWWDEQLSWSR